MKPRLLITMVVVLVAAGAQAQFNFKKLDPLNILKGGEKVIKGAGGIGIKEEMAIGGSVAVEIVARFGGLDRDEPATLRLNQIGKALGYYSNRPDLTYRFGLLKSSAINAFSAPGGYVFLTRGLYDLIENDDQLAGVLAHEIAHVTERHALKIIARGEFLGGVTQVLGEVGNATNKRDLTTYSAGIGQITGVLFEKGFDPATEYHADKVARELASITGYAPNGLKECLMCFQKHEGRQKELFSTHPPLKDRIERL